MTIAAEIPVIQTVFTEQESWADFYDQSLEEKGVLVRPIIAWTAVDRTSYEEIILNPAFPQYWDRFEGEMIHLQGGLIDVVHISERAADTHMGSMVLQLANYDEVPVVIIPEDLSDGLGEPDKMEATK